MIPTELRDEIGKFVSKIRSLPGLEHVIIYGSVARGEYDEDSDIDALVLFADEKSRKENEEKVREAAAQVRGKLPVLPSVYARDALKEGDPEFFRGVFKDGIIVFSEKIQEIPVKEALSAKPFVIFTYSVKHLDTAEKTKFSHALLGRSTRAGGKEYEYGGVLDKVKGKFLGKGVVIAKQAAAQELREFFKGHEVEYEEYLVWADKEFAKKL